VSVSIWGSKQTLADGWEISRTIQGAVGLPTPLTSLTAVASGDTVTLFSTEITDPDTAGYELRLGDSWGGGIFVAFNETPNIRLVGVRPGTHTFWMDVKNNAGYYSGTPVSTTVVVYYPSGYVDKNVWSWDFDGIGTFENTEHCLYSLADALKCSHAGNILMGIWTSPVYDLGSIKTVRVWGDFICEYSYAGGTWDVLFPSGALWSSRIAPGIRWSDILNPVVASRIQATLKWGTLPGSLTNEVDYLEIIAPEINARYVQVVITLTDPDIASNLYLKTLNMKAAYWN
jgi:hypothetical protein